MKEFYIADAARFDNQAVTSFFVIASISSRDTKGGKPYLALTLADKTGQFEARMWEDFADVVSHCSAGCYVKAQGQVSKYQGRFQITLTKLRLAATTEVDTADFIPTSQFDIPTMAAELRGYVAAFRNRHLQRLVLAFLDDPTLGPAFLKAPAAKRLHHAWIGGLLEHVLSLVRVCRATAPFYPEVDPDLLVTGAILHDIGKVRELSWASSFDYTLEGQLIGHISIAQGMLHEKIAALDAQALQEAEAKTLSAVQEPAISGPHADVTPEDGSPAAAEPAEEKDGPAVLVLFSETAADGDSSVGTPPLPEASVASDQDAPIGPFPAPLRLLVEHMLLAHHGKLEFGSPKLPMTPEAMLLSALDDLEAKFQTLRSEFAAAKTAGRPVDETTEWVRSMERPLFNSQAWLAAKSE